MIRGRSGVGGPPACRSTCGEMPRSARQAGGGSDRSKPDRTRELAAHLRRDVAEREALVVLINDIGGDLLRHDLVKDRGRVAVRLAAGSRQRRDKSSDRVGAASSAERRRRERLARAGSRGEQQCRLPPSCCRSGAAPEAGRIAAFGCAGGRAAFMAARSCAARGAPLTQRPPAPSPAPLPWCARRRAARAALPGSLWQGASGGKGPRLLQRPEACPQ